MAATESSGTNLNVRPVTTRRDLSGFIRVPHRVYRDDPAWVPPLHLERRLHLSTDHNPYFEHARWQGWVAYRDGRPLGRISAQVDELVLRHRGADLGLFGFLDAPDDPEVYDALFRAAEGWLVEEGMGRAQGPFSLSINHECGLLVEGFDGPPAFMMGHNGPWAPAHVERLGYQPVKDLLAYRVHGDLDYPPVMRSLLRRYGDRIALRPLRGKKLEEEMALVREIFNEGWAGNWGFVPFTRAELEDLGKTLRLFVDDEFVQIGSVDGEPVAFIVLLPNVNEIIADLGGRLLPLAWARAAWRFLRHRIRVGRIALMGVRPRFQGTPLGAALALKMIVEIQRVGWEWGMRDAELSWILEDNKPMRRIVEMLGAEVYKRYRIFEKALPGAPGRPS